MRALDAWQLNAGAGSRRLDAATELRSVFEAYVSACRAVIYTGESAKPPG